MEKMAWWKIYRMVWVLLLPLLFARCDGQEDLIFQGPYHVRFTETEARVVENNNYPLGQNRNEPLEVSMHLVSPLLGADTEVTYALYGDAVEGEDYEILGGGNGTVTIPAGESFGFIQFRPLNNRENEGDRDIVFTITGVNNGLQIGRSGGGIIGRSMAYTISDDDCLVDLRLFEGTWEVAEQEGEGEDVFEYTYEINIKPDFNFNNRVVIEGLAGVEGAQVFANLDLCQRQLLLPEQQVTGIGNLGSARSEEPGSFDVEGGRITFSYEMDARGNILRSITAIRND